MARTAAGYPASWSMAAVEMTTTFNRQFSTAVLRDSVSSLAISTQFSLKLTLYILVERQDKREGKICNECTIIKERLALFISEYYYERKPLSMMNLDSLEFVY